MNPGSARGRLPRVVLLAAMVLIAALATPSWPSSGRAAADRTQEIDALARAAIPAGGPGAAILVVLGDETAYQKGFGLADLQRGTPISAVTLFDLASCSKHITAMAVLLLANRGLLGLDDDVRKTLPELPAYDPRRPIRIRDLLNQVSGLRDYLNLLPASPTRANKMKNEDVLKLLARQRLNFPTGTRWQYSNSNYCMLALIVERISRRTLGQFMRAELFAGLGMTSSTVFEDAAQVIPNRARGYIRSRGGYRISESQLVMTGDGGVLTSITDLAPWFRMLDRGGLVNPDLQRQMFVPGRLDSGRAHEYGFGWFIGEENGRQVMDHSGGWYGTSTYLVRYPGVPLTVAVLSNNESFDPYPLAGKIAAICLQGR